MCLLALNLSKSCTEAITCALQTVTYAAALTIEHCILSVMARLIVQILFMLFFIYNAVKMSEYKVYWLMDFPLINSWVYGKK